MATKNGDFRLRFAQFTDGAGRPFVTVVLESFSAEESMWDTHMGLTGNMMRVQIQGTVKGQKVELVLPSGKQHTVYAGRSGGDLVKRLKSDQVVGITAWLAKFQAWSAKK